MAACAAFRKESRMKLVEPTKFNRKSGGAQWRDLRFQSFAPPLLSGIYSANFQLRTLECFRKWCRPNPDFLWSFVGPPNCMRSRLAGTSHATLASAALQEIREAIGLFVVPAGRDHSSRSLSGHSNCETALGCWWGRWGCRWRQAPFYKPRRTAGRYRQPCPAIL